MFTQTFKNPNACFEEMKHLQMSTDKSEWSNYDKHCFLCYVVAMEMSYFPLSFGVLEGKSEIEKSLAMLTWYHKLWDFEELALRCYLTRNCVSWCHEMLIFSSWFIEHKLGNVCRRNY